jgi:polyhydroxybutyrate depolymerase
LSVRLRAAFALLGVVFLASACNGGGISSTSGRRSVPPDQVAVKPSPGCQEPSEQVAPGEVTLTVSSGGIPRTYIRHVPPAYQRAQPLPLVLDLHGSAEGAEVHAINSALGPFGDEQGFVTITPQGTGSGLDSHWDTARGTVFDSADSRFIRDLLDEVAKTVCVDERRVYVAGYSGGAFMASAIACVYADRVAAVALVAGIRDLEGCDPARPVPVVTFHGTDDEFLAFEGGLGPRARALPPDSSGRTIGEITGIAIEGPSITAQVAAWAKRNDCAAKPDERDVASDVTLVRYECPADADVDFYRIEGGGHSWPASDFSAQIESVIGPTTYSISANEVMWEFFEHHPLRRR